MRHAPRKIRPIILRRLHLPTPGSQDRLEAGHRGVGSCRSATEGRKRPLISIRLGLSGMIGWGAIEADDK